MKLSLAWIFDHIDANWKDQDIAHICARFNAVTAEIDHVHTIDFHMNNFALGKIIGLTENKFQVFIPEFGPEPDKKFVLTGRSDVGAPFETKTSFSPQGERQTYCMVKREGHDITWASLADFGVDKGGLLPALDATDQDLDGRWKKLFEHQDIILEVDNKTITHRPDMWGHRGFAREIAALLNLKLKPESEFLAQLRVMQFDTQSKATHSTPFVIENKAPEICKRFTGFYFPDIQNKPTNIFVMSRLLKVDSRPISGIVDLTNYLMLDWSQPVHAYDADKITDKKLIIRMAHKTEKLHLLDGNTIELANDDLVVADSKKPMCLAGIKGGVDDSISDQTKAVFLEAGNWDAGVTRKTALRHKTRTDASSRFEKTLDPNLTTQAQMRFVKLLEQFDIKATMAEEIIAVGPEAKEEVIEVTHDFLQRRLGAHLSEEQVIEPLTKIGFRVLKSFDDSGKILYMITVPSFRSSKDIKIKEDILEEVVRFYGFERIKLELQKIERRPFNLTPIMRLRKIKAYLAGAACMTEQQNYAFFDEEIVNTLGLTPEVGGHLVNPISENYYRLASSLIPGLCKNIRDNHMQYDNLAFFEFGRIWKPGKTESEPAQERQELSGIFFEKRKEINFYEAKNTISELLRLLGFSVSGLTFKKPEKTNSWYNIYQTADILYNNQKIGTLGKVDHRFLRKLDVLPESDALVFELDGDILLGADLGTKRYEPISKFQETYIDLSLMVPVTITTQTLQETLKTIDILVKRVDLIDFFEKAEWTNIRSLTFRVWLSNDEKTLEKHEIDAVWQKAVAHVEQRGVQIRA